MDIAAIGSHLQLSRSTLTSYINALEALFIIERVPAWTKTDYERVGKQDKLFMTDTGLMAALLEWNFEKIQFDGERHGKFIETLVFTQLAALIDAQTERYTLYHYKDRDRREIDFIIENSENNILGIEVKSGSHVSKDSFKHLKWFKEHMDKGKNFVGIVFYSGAHSIPFGDKLWAVPLSTLWQKPS